MSRRPSGRQVAWFLQRLGEKQRLRCSSGRSDAKKVPEVVVARGTSEANVVASLLDYYRGQQPVVLKGFGSDLPAVQRWGSFDYLEQAAGADVPCDVEMGSYNRGEKLTLTFGQYMQYLRLWHETYGAAASGSSEEMPPDQILYLAQNDLTAFGCLSDDVPIPSFFGDGRIGEGRIYSSMLWLGPRGCVSPLHYDPLDNLLMQVVGRKRVSMLPAQTNQASLYAGQEHDQQNNTSAVDVEGPDLARFPMFESVAAEIRSTTLDPGDALYVPSRWWHHVRSLDLSISVNVWWR
jgi:[protein]-arginine 3-hydroxylase / protease